MSAAPMTLRGMQIACVTTNGWDVLARAGVDTSETMFSTVERELNLKHVLQVDFPLRPS